MPNAKGLGYSQNRRVSGQRLCLLILQISISADRDVPAFSKAGTFFSSPILKKRQRNVRCIVEVFWKYRATFSGQKAKTCPCVIWKENFSRYPLICKNLSVVKWEGTTREAEPWQTASFCPLESRKGNLKQNAGIVSPSPKLFWEIWDKTGLWFT